MTCAICCSFMSANKVTASPAKLPSSAPPQPPRPPPRPMPSASTPITVAANGRYALLSIVFEMIC